MLYAISQDSGKSVWREYVTVFRRYIIMKKNSIFVSLMILALAMFVMVSCGGGTTLSADVQGEDHIVITADKAAEGDFLQTGSLIVGADQQIVIDSQLDPGAIQLDFISGEGLDDIEGVPEEPDSVAYTANVSGVESQAVSFGEGEFMVRVTVTEKASGTVDITVKGFEE